MLAADRADPALGREVAPRARVFDQFDRRQETAGSDLTDQRMIGEPGQSPGEISAKRPAGAVVQTLLGDDPRASTSTSPTRRPTMTAAIGM